jgi:hypothetical protein
MFFVKKAEEKIQTTETEGKEWVRETR